jgi:hypothetical protein
MNTESELSVTQYLHNVIFQHPAALYRSDFGLLAPSKCNVVHCSFIGHYFTTGFGLTDHLQVYRCCGQGFCRSL